MEVCVLVRQATTFLVLYPDEFFVLCLTGIDNAGYVFLYRRLFRRTQSKGLKPFNLEDDMVQVFGYKRPDFCKLLCQFLRIYLLRYVFGYFLSLD